MSEGVPERGWDRERNPPVPVLRCHERRLRRSAPVAFQAQGKRGKLSTSDPSQKKKAQGDSFSGALWKLSAFPHPFPKVRSYPAVLGDNWSPLQGKLLLLIFQTLSGRIFRMFGIFQPVSTWAKATDTSSPGSC